MDFFDWCKRNGLVRNLIGFVEKYHLDLVFYFLLSLVIIYFYWDSKFLNFVGIFLILGGFLFSWIAEIQLGNSFSTFPEARNLITSGIYSKIRHPVYSGNILFMLGYVVYTFGEGIINLVFIFALMFVLAIQIIRIKSEEKVLEKKFGKKYLNYKKETWF